VNSTGGVFGRKIEIIKRDDKYEADIAAANTKALIETDDVFALFGYVGTPTSNAATPIFTQAKVPFFAPYSGAQSLREPFNKLIFNIRASYFDETEHLVIVW
jgi:ABC-type branched-subunit amino acid transport system substrate-binding protein